MAGLVSKLFLLIMQYVFMDCTKHALRWVYKPYGIQMCRALCKDTPDTFYYKPEDLSCHRVSGGATKVSPLHSLTEDIRTNFPTGCIFQTGLDVCRKESTETERGISARQQTVTTDRKPRLSREEGKNPPETQPELTTPVGGSELIQYNRNTSLYQACEEGQLDVVKHILSQGLENINSRGKRRRTPVMAAARKGHFRVFDYLISQGCDLFAVDDYNYNVLHVACVGGNTDIVRKLIISEKLDKESRGRHGRTPIMCVAYRGHIEVFDLLVGVGCNQTALDNYKNNILHVACFGGSVDMVQYILSQNIVSIDSRGYHGRTPLMSAAVMGQKRVFDFLVGKDCDLAAVDDYNSNIVHVACIFGHVDMVQYILSHNLVSIESRGPLGRTPVLVAAANNQKGVFDFLVGKGCDLTALDNTKNNILHLACVGGGIDIVQYILSHNIVRIESRGRSGRTPVLTAAGNQQKGVFDFLIRKGCSLKAVDNQGNNILHVACIGGNVEIVRYILSRNIVSTESRGYAGRTSVLLAAEMGKKGVLDFLVKKGSKLTTVDDKGNNILHVACKSGHVDMVKYLMTMRAVAGMEKAKNKHGRTPVEVAKREGHVAFERLLKGRK